MNYMTILFLVVCIIGLETRCVVGKMPKEKSVEQVIRELKNCLQECQSEMTDSSAKENAKTCVIECADNAKNDLSFHVLAE